MYRNCQNKKTKCLKWRMMQRVTNIKWKTFVQLIDDTLYFVCIHNNNAHSYKMSFPSYDGKPDIVDKQR